MSVMRKKEEVSVGVTRQYRCCHCHVVVVVVVVVVVLLSSPGCHEMRVSMSATREREEVSTMH